MVQKNRFSLSRFAACASLCCLVLMGPAVAADGILDQLPTASDLEQAIQRGGGRSAGGMAGSLYPAIRVRVTSPRHVVLSSQATGTVVSLAIRDGEYFQEGDVLLRIDPTLEQIMLDRAEAVLDRQKFLLAMTEELVTLGTKGELEQEMVRADVRQAEAEVALCQTRLDRMTVKAPFSGRAGEVYVRELQGVAEGHPLFEILEESSMELEFIVASSWLPWFTPGTKFMVRIDELNTTYQAVLTRLGGRVDPLSKSLNAYAAFVDAGHDLMEGMTGDAIITPPDGWASP